MTLFEKEKIVFIGAGSMAESIIKGLLKNEILLPEQIWVTNHSDDIKLNKLKTNYSIRATRDHNELLQNATMIILAVKPKDVRESIGAIRNYLTKEQLIISIIAGVSIDFFADHLPDKMPIIRTMPNTSAAVGYSATAIAKGSYTTDEHLIKAKELFSAIGTVTTVKEDELHTVTGISGSGPAYLYYLAEAMEEKAIEFGLHQGAARHLIIQTFLGAAEMMSRTEESPEKLRQQVTSPKGTTEAGIQALKDHHFKRAVHECISAAVHRSRELEELYKPSTKNN